MNLTNLLTQPTTFFAALVASPAKSARFLWLVLVSGLVSGVASVLLERSLLVAQQPSAAPQQMIVSQVALLLAGILGSLLFWLMLWGLGTLGAGRDSRAAEVYGATFLPSLIWALILLPIGALFAPVVDVPPLDVTGLEGKALAAATVKHSLAVRTAYGSAFVVKLTTWAGYAVFLWQAYLAWIGFKVSTKNTGNAWRGVLVPVAVLGALGVVFYLLGQALTKLGSGA
jgi:hypothetical protein